MLSSRFFAAVGVTISCVAVATTAFAQQAAAPPAPAPAPAAPIGPAPQAADPAPTTPPAPMGGPEAMPPPPPTEPPPPAAPIIYVEQPPVPPLMPRTRHVHEGFYLRLSAGPGGLWTSTTLSKGTGSASTSGSGASLDLAMGGTVGSGLVLGGALLAQEAFTPARRGLTTFSDGASSSLPFVLLGPMIDAYPNPRTGFHFGGLLGLSALGLRDRNDKWSSGVGLAAWTGYLWWVSSEWSVGATLRFSAAWSGRKLTDAGGDHDVTDTARSLNLMLSAAYH